MMRSLALALTALSLLLIGCASVPTGNEVRINEVQVIGSHNSYHIQPHPSVMELIERNRRGSSAALEYTHPPLPVQFSRGIRQIELDIFPDPQGGAFAKPSGPFEAQKIGLPAVPNHDPEGKLLKPGYKIIHMPNVDYLSTALTLRDALIQTRDWSKSNPHHFPILILLELKTASRESPRYTTRDLDDLEKEILSVFSRDRILTPDDVRRDQRTLPDALKKYGWPTIKAARGKVMFALDNEDATRDLYLRDAPVLQNKLMFVSVPKMIEGGPSMRRHHPAAAWMKMNEAIRDYDQIQQFVRDGFLVRTRADIPNVEVKANDTTRRDRALTSGAQYISTDYPEPNPAFSPYAVKFPNGIVVQTNPLIGNPNLQGVDLERK